MLEKEQQLVMSFDGLLPSALYHYFNLGPTGLYLGASLIEMVAAFVAGYNCIPFVYRYLLIVWSVTFHRLL